MAWCLSFHASYRCRHAGACCDAGWTIPFEDGTIAARAADGACSFFDGTTHLCAIHSARGVHALPLTCRMFPRVVLHDPRGTFVSLSHFCPTAAALLFEPHGDTSVVEAPPALVDIGELDGLDARQVWPPLLRPGVMMDLDSYAAWERRGVILLTQARGTAAGALAALAALTGAITAWTPGTGDLHDTVNGAFDTSPPPDGPLVDRDALAVKRWLAARLFGAWIAYQGNGLAATLAYLRDCLGICERELAAGGGALEAIRRSDLRIVHGAAS